MSSEEFMPGCADEDLIIMPRGESHTVGDARHDGKLRRRVAAYQYLQGRMQLELLRVYETMEATPPTDVKDLIRIMSEAAVIVGLAAFDKVEDVEQRRRERGGRTRAAAVRNPREVNWGDIVRARLREDLGTPNKTILSVLIGQGGAEDADKHKVNRLIAKVRKEVAAT